MLIGIDHLVVAVPDPDAAADLLVRDLGLEATGGGRHAAGGTRNRLAWFGDSYLELIGVDDPSLVSGLFGDATLRALRGSRGAGLAAWSIATDDAVADAALLRERGADLGEPTSGERVRPDGRVVRWVLALPPRLGPLGSPFLIEHDPAGAEWTPAEREERQAFVHPVGGPVRLTALELPAADVARATTRYLAAGIGPFRPALVGGGARDAALGTQTIRVVPATEGATGPSDESPWPLATIRLQVQGRAIEPREVEALGCRWAISGS